MQRGGLSLCNDTKNTLIFVKLIIIIIEMHNYKINSTAKGILMKIALSIITLALL